MEPEASGEFVPLPDKAHDAQKRFVSNPDATYSAWFRTNAARKPIQEFNTHPISRYTIPKIFGDTFHEDAHFLQTAAWGARIAIQELGPASGVTAVHSPENTQLETVAQAMELFATERLLELSPPEERWLVEFHAKYNEHRLMVLHNAILRANKQPEQDIDEIIQSAVTALPFEKEEKMRNTITKSLKVPTIRAGNLGYMPGLILARSVFELPSRLRQKTLSELYVQPMTPAQMQKLVVDAKQQAASLSL